MTQILVMPDIHGRGFWDKIVDVQDKYDAIIFLGDYFDPYPQESIFSSDAIENFDCMLEELNLDKCEFLIGNHDAAYLNPDLPMCSRYSYKFEKEIKKLLKQLPNLTTHTWYTVGKTTYLFTHAGINKKWMDRHPDMWNLNKNGLLIDSPELIYAACEVGKIRGGWFPSGGFMWNDVREMGEPDIPYYQVFGHTQLNAPIITDKYACIDVRRPFTIDESGIHDNFKGLEQV